MSNSHEETTAITGRVKWFNNKAGYGFITITDGDKSGTDVFVHHTRIIVSSEQYKYLVQGEYVEFELADLQDDEKHEFQASNVKGVQGGKLMCETRNESRASLRQRREEEDGDQSRPVRQQRRRPGPPRINDDEWVLVRRRPGMGASRPRGRRNEQQEDA
jgi:CspA family cold shock protein